MHVCIAQGSGHAQVEFILIEIRKEAHDRADAKEAKDE